MNFIDKLHAAERAHQSLLCVGLDPDPAKLPGAWRGQPDRIFDFCARIVDDLHAAADLVRRSLGVA